MSKIFLKLSKLAEIIENWLKHKPFSYLLLKILNTKKFFIHPDYLEVEFCHVYFFPKLAVRLLNRIVLSQKINVEIDTNDFKTCITIDKFKNKEKVTMEEFKKEWEKLFGVDIKIK